MAKRVSQYRKLEREYKRLRNKLSTQVGRIEKYKLAVPDMDYYKGIIKTSKGRKSARAYQYIIEEYTYALKETTLNKARQFKASQRALKKFIKNVEGKDLSGEETSKIIEMKSRQLDWEAEKKREKDWYQRRGYKEYTEDVEGRQLTRKEVAENVFEKAYSRFADEKDLWTKYLLKDYVTMLEEEGFEYDEMLRRAQELVDKRDTEAYDIIEQEVEIYYKTRKGRYK